MDKFSGVVRYLGQAMLTDVVVVKITSVDSVMKRQEHALETADIRDALRPVTGGSLTAATFSWTCEKIDAAGVMLAS